MFTEPFVKKSLLEKRKEFVPHEVNPFLLVKIPIDKGGINVFSRVISPADVSMPLNNTLDMDSDVSLSRKLLFIFLLLRKQIINGIQSKEDNPVLEIFASFLIGATLERKISFLMEPVLSCQKGPPFRWRFKWLGGRFLKNFVCKREKKMKLYPVTLR